MNALTDEHINTLRQWAEGLPAKDMDELRWRIEEWLEAHIETQCETEGHYPDNDACGKPEHRYCYVCNKSMPNVDLPDKSK